MQTHLQSSSHRAWRRGCTIPRPKLGLACPTGLRSPLTPRLLSGSAVTEGRRPRCSVGTNDRPAEPAIFPGRGGFSARPHIACQARTHRRLAGFHSRTSPNLTARTSDRYAPRATASTRASTGTGTFLSFIKCTQLSASTHINSTGSDQSEIGFLSRAASKRVPEPRHEAKTPLT